MDIYTGYFAQLKKYEKANLMPVSIARFTPKFYHGVSCDYFSPVSSLLKMYKDGEIDWESYEVAYLSGITTEGVMNNLKYLCDMAKNSGKDGIVLLCYEKGQCHRHTLAKFANDELDVGITEFVV